MILQISMILAWVWAICLSVIYARTIPRYLCALIRDLGLIIIVLLTIKLIKGLMQ